MTVQPVVQLDIERWHLAPGVTPWQRNRLLECIRVLFSDLAGLEIVEAF
jgi:hypothetical protein